jgi:hypothetical protein
MIGKEPQRADEAYLVSAEPSIRADAELELEIGEVLKGAQDAQRKAAEEAERLTRARRRRRIDTTRGP